MCSFALRNPADGYLIVSQENGGCDASRSFGYYIRAWPALPITTHRQDRLLQADEIILVITEEAMQMILPETILSDAAHLSVTSQQHH